MASGTVYKRETPGGSSAWVAHITWQEGGKRRQSKRAFRTKKEAQAAMTDLLASHQRGTFVTPTRTLVADYSATWLDSLAMQGRKATTLRGYRSVLEHRILPHLASIGVQELQAKDLDAMYASLLRRGLSMTSVRQAHAVMSKMLHDAERQGLVTRNVARSASPPPPAAARAKAPEIRVWSPDELAEFLAFIESTRNDTMFRLMALTGMRRSEVVGLRWVDVQIEHNRLTVYQAANVVDGVEVLDTPKTRRSRRVIELDAETVASLVRHRARQAERYLRLGIGATASNRVFTNDLGQPIRPDSVSQAFARLVDQSGLARVRLHDLRHTHASQLLMADVNVKVVSERLGHASVSFTLDVYGHVMPGQQAAAASAAAALVSQRRSDRQR